MAPPCGSNGRFFGPGCRAFFAPVRSYRTAFGSKPVCRPTPRCWLPCRRYSLTYTTHRCLARSPSHTSPVRDPSFPARLRLSATAELGPCVVRRLRAHQRHCWRSVPCNLELATHLAANSESLARLPLPGSSPSLVATLPELSAENLRLQLALFVAGGPVKSTPGQVPIWT